MKRLLHGMKYIRCVEEQIALEYPKQQMRCPVHLSIGQEAVAVGVCTNLNHSDFAVSGHRAHAHYLAKGGNLKAMIAEIYGKATGCSGGKGGSMHLVDTKVGFMGSTAIVAGTIPVGVGLGLSIKIKNEDKISSIFFGEGATEEGVFYESLNFASIKNLPILFICENNLYSVYSPLAVRQVKNRKIFEMVKAIGIKSDEGNGNDVLEVFAKTKAAVSFIRNEQKPYFLEFATYRHREHCGPYFDNNIGYRSEAEFKKWKTLDPIPCLQQQLNQKAIISDDLIQAMNDTISNEVKEAFETAQNAEFPKDKALYTNVFKA